MTPAADLVQYLACRLVDEPDVVRVDEIEQEGDLVLRLYVAEPDRGKIIGRNGRMVRALRTVVRASGVHQNRRVLLEIVE